MKRIVDIIIQIIIIFLLVLTIVLPKKEFSDNENRYLQKFPTFNVENIVNGKFMTLMSDYISDHFPLREKLLSLKTNLFKMIGIKRQNGIYYADDNYLIEEYGKPENNEKIVRVVNRFIDANSNVKYDFMLVPTSAYILKDKLSNYNLNYDEKKTINFFKQNIKGNYIDVSNILLSNNDKYIYYRTDHHWTTRGAYYAYYEYCKNNDIIPRDYLFSEVSKNFYGTLYSKVLDNTIEPDIIEKVVDNNTYIVKYPSSDMSSIYNEKYLNEKDKYSYFLNGNQSLITIANPYVFDNEILIIKDSYANSFIPLLINHYSTIHVIDPRYYKNSISSYIKDHSINHVLFLYNIGTIDDDLGILTIN